MISSLVDSVITEKRMQYREFVDIQIDSELLNSYGLFIKAEINELKRIFSNIINNSVDAFENKTGKINVVGNEEDKFCKIVISDNGKGIPSSRFENTKVLEQSEKLGIKMIPKILASIVPIKK